MNARWRITVFKAESPQGRLRHWWTEGQLFTECGLPCAYHDGLETKLASGWMMAGIELIDCPHCR